MTKSPYTDTLSIRYDPNNPSKADLVDAWARSYDHTHVPRGTLKPAEVEFSLAGETIPVVAQLMSIGYESGAPHMLLFTALVRSPEAYLGVFEGFYNAEARTGTISPQRQR